MTEYARFEGRGKCGMTGKKSHRKSKVQGWRWLFTLRLRISRHDGSSCCGQECPRSELERADRENGRSGRVAPGRTKKSKRIKVDQSRREQDFGPSTDIGVRKCPDEFK